MELVGTSKSKAFIHLWELGASTLGHGGIKEPSAGAGHAHPCMLIDVEGSALLLCRGAGRRFQAPGTVPISATTHHSHLPTTQVLQKRLLNK